MPACDTCLYWRHWDEMKAAGCEGITKGLGQCRRYPPAITTNPKAISEFPKIEPHEWCGEYKKK